MSFVATSVPPLSYSVPVHRAGHATPVHAAEPLPTSVSDAVTLAAALVCWTQVHTQYTVLGYSDQFADTSRPSLQNNRQ